MASLGLQRAAWEVLAWWALLLPLDQEVVNFLEAHFRLEQFLVQDTGFMELMWEAYCTQAMEEVLQWGLVGTEP